MTIRVSRADGRDCPRRYHDCISRQSQGVTWKQALRSTQPVISPQSKMTHRCARRSAFSSDENGKLGLSSVAVLIFMMVLPVTGLLWRADKTKIAPLMTRRCLGGIPELRW